MILPSDAEVARYRQMRREWVRSVVFDPTGRRRTGPVILDRHDAATLLRDLPLLTSPEIDL